MNEHSLNATAMAGPLSLILAAWVNEAIDRSPHPPILFISGAQGIGKSSALRVLAGCAGGRIAVLALDDFYLPRALRQTLARTTHPLCVTRGPPGTHDLDALNAVLDRLTQPGRTEAVAAPWFDKVTDDRGREFAYLTPAPRAIVVEGWLMGVQSDPSAARAAPLNEVEKEDGDGVWRDWQECHLIGPYAQLWRRADAFLHLDAPSFECVLGWRLQQEATNLGVAILPPERRRWVERFVLHFERLTRRMLSDRRCAGVGIRVDAARQVRSAEPPR